MNDHKTKMILVQNEEEKRVRVMCMYGVTNADMDDMLSCVCPIAELQFHETMFDDVQSCVDFLNENHFHAPLAMMFVLKKYDIDVDSLLAYFE
jgi:hypothetical protein